MTYEEMVVEMLDFLQQECDTTFQARLIAEAVRIRIEGMEGSYDEEL